MDEFEFSSGSREESGDRTVPLHECGQVTSNGPPNVIVCFQFIKHKQKQTTNETNDNKTNKRPVDQPYWQKVHTSAITMSDVQGGPKVTEVFRMATL